MRKKISSLLVLLLVVGIGGVGIKTAFSQTSFDSDEFIVKSTLLIYPATVGETTWSGFEHVLSPDLDEDSIYQKFNARNSAYVPLDVLIIDDEEISNSSPSTADAGAPATDTLTPVSETADDSLESLIPEEETNSVVPDEEVNSSEESQSEESAPANESSSEQESQSETSPVSLKKATESLFAFFGSVTELFPFANTATVVDALPPDVEQIEVPEEVQEEQIVTEESVSEEATSEVIPLDAQNEATSTEAQVTNEVNEGASEEEIVREVVPEGFVRRTLALSDFSTPDLKPGEFISSIQLRMSLGAQYDSQESVDLPSLEINYQTPSSTQNIGSVTIDDEISNALNGGYFLFALPQVVNIQELKDVSIEIVYEGDIDNLKGLYLDAVWLEVEVEKVDKELLEAQVKADTQERLEDPKLSTLLSEQVDFTQDELPRFSLRYNSQRNIAVRFVRDLFGRPLASIEEVKFKHNDAGDIGVVPQIDVTEDGLLSIQLSENDRERLKPGEYEVEFTVNEGGVEYVDTFSFQWGLLSINPDQTVNGKGEEVSISMGSLSPNGNTVCDANLQLYIIDPQDVVYKTLVTPSGVCNGNTFVEVPDYTASFVPTAVGEYEMYLERLDVDGTVLSHTSDTFFVQEQLPFVIKRTGPSRIYPKEAYPMELIVSSQGAWEGKLIEVVPASFVISETDAVITQYGEELELSWDIDVSASSSKSVSYVFDAPDISPFLYTVGFARLESNETDPATLIPLSTPTTTEEEVTVPEEDVIEVPSEQEEVATTSEVEIQSEVVATTSEVLPPTEATIPNEEVVPTPEELPQQEQEPTLFERIIDIFTPEQEVDEEVSVELQEPTAMDQVVASDITELSTASSTVSTSSTEAVPVQASSSDTVVFKEHRKWQIASDATGSMIVYWTSGASVPAGWTCLSCGSGTFYQKFVRGGPTYNSTGGSATHSHNASGTVAATGGAANSENVAGGDIALAAHAHNITPSFTATSSLPAYRNLRVIQNNSAGQPATIPAGAILMFDTTLPSGWARYTALDARYPRGENALANAGNNTHRHRVTGTTTAASGSTVLSRTGGTQVTASAITHVHTISTTSPAVSIEPPFISVIFATSSVATSSPIGAITMWTDTPPAQWQNASAVPGDPFYDNFIKGSATYGTTGGASTHTHADIANVVSSAVVGTDNGRTGATGIGSTHTHLVTVSSAASASNLPPYLTAIFARKYGPVPLYTQTSYIWYANANTNTPTDAWPAGAEDLLVNEPIDASQVPVKNGDVVRVRMQLSVSNSTSTADTFKLQYASTTALCSAASTWIDVGGSTSTAMWRGFNNAGVSDGATIASTTIPGTDVAETYEETNPTATTPNTIGIGQQGEWDFVLQQNNAYEGATYCFRMVKSTGSVLFAYTEYPTLVTNEAPNPPTLNKLFDNEKVGTTTPDFEFFGIDAEANDLTYQIQVDDDYTFASANIDRNTVTNSTQFSNIPTPADKDPFTQGETILFNNNTALINGTTYYWRVRAKDPSGSNAYGNWSTIQSFTIDTSVTLSTWFQTTEEQFDTNAYTRVEAVPSDQVQLVTGSTTGTMFSDEITFSEAQVGTAWGSFSFSDTETSSDLKYTIQYNDNGVWTDIPDSALPGNSAGFDTSPVSLIDLDKEIYTELRIEANFTNSGASPSLQDWTVTWGYRIETPTITAPFASEKVGTTTPTFEFTTTDPQNDILTYEIQWSTTDSFTSSTTRISGTHSGFINSDTATDTSPFNSGDVIQFTTQTNDSFINGATYWWRVRAKDPLGSDSYSFYSDPRSFTVDTSVTVSTWYQSTAEQFDGDVLSGAITIASSSDETLIAYAEGTVTTPRYREWNGKTWLTEASALDVGATINWLLTESSPVRDEYLLATMGTDADINVQVFSNGAWGNLQETTATAASSTLRGFGIAYEQLSGDGMIVSCDGDADPNYYIWNGTNWTSGGGIGLSATVNCGWVKLVSDPYSDEIVAITRDINGVGYEARVWNGSSWGNSSRWGFMSDRANEGIAAAYEESGNQLVVAVSNGGNASFAWRSWNGTSWSAGTSTQALGNDFEWGKIASDVGSDNMVLCYMDEDSDIGSVRWTGSGWTGQTEHEVTGNAKAGRAVDCEFEVGGARDSYIMLAYSDDTNVRYIFWNNTTWSAEASVSTIQDAFTVQLRRNEEGRLQLSAYDDTNDRYDYSTWRDTAWSAFQTLENNASVTASPFKEPFMMAPRHPDMFEVLSKATSTVTVATSTQNSITAYAEGSITTPRYREWNGTSWSTESSALDVGAAINWVVTKSAPVENEYILATMGTDADVNVQVFSNGSWGNLQEVTATIANTTMRGFDVAYEQTSGDAMIVSCDGDANPTYYIWNGTSWTNGGGIGLAAGNTCGWVKLISDPVSDEIIAVTRDTTGTAYEARVWSGSVWGDSSTWGSMNQANHEGIAAEYEESGNQAVVAVSNGTGGSFSWRSWNGTVWSAATAQALGDDFEAGEMVSDVGSDNLALCYVDEDGDIGVVRWTGAAWVATVELETAWTTAGNIYNDRPIDCAFETIGARNGYILAVYSDQTNTRYRTWNGAAWVAEASVSTLGVSPRVQLNRTSSGLVQTLIFASSTDRYNYSDWNGTTWSALQTLETDASVGASPFKEPFMMSPENPTVTATVVGDPLVSFYEGSGPYWQQMSWNDRETGGSSILYQVEYYDGDSWELVPNSLIPGNSVGTTTSPIDLSNVLPVSTYDEIRPVANMTCSTLCPALKDWTITWAGGLTISGTAQQYNQSTNLTSGTVGVALNGVVQIGKTGTISGGVWTITNVNATAGDVVTVFISGAVDSGEAVAVTVYDGVGDIDGMNLYERHLSIGSDDRATVTNANLSTYDFTNTEDIFFNVDASNDLSMCATTGCGDSELIIKALNSYQPGGGADVLTHDFENNGTLKLNGNTMRVSGSWDNNATTTPATSTVIFIATSTAESVNETGAVNPSFNNVTFGLSTSTAVWTPATVLDINGNLTVTGGTFARGGLALTLAGNLSNGVNGIWTGVGTTTFDGTSASTWSDASVALQNIGRVVIDGTIKSVTLGSNVRARSIRIGSDDTFDASPSGFNVTVLTNWVNNNTFNARTGTVIFAATTTGRIINAGASNFYNLSFTGSGGAWSFTGSTLGINNDLSITAGTVTLPTATTTIAGSFSNSGTFAHNNGQLYFTSGSAETLTLGGTAFTNAFYNARFTGAGSWTFTEANATTSNLFRITLGNVTLPSNTLTVGDTFTNSGGTFSHNNGTVKFINTGTKVIDTNSSFFSLRFVGSGSNFSFLDSSVTALGNLTVTAGTLTLPSGTLSIGGSLTNSATLANNNGTVLFNSSDTGETINTGNSSLYNMTFNSGTGGWTVSESATTTNNTTLTSASSFTLASGKRLSVGGTFTNSVGGAGTTWTGSTLVLQAGTYSLNAKTNTGDVYATLQIKSNTDIKMWNSSASVYTVDPTGSLYSQDHSSVDGDLYIFGNYPRTSGTEYWSYATDFDGTALSSTSRQADVRFASGASASFSASTLNVTGIASATTTIANQGGGTYLIGVSGGTTTASYYNFSNLGATGISLGGANKVTSLGNGVFSPGVGGGTTLTVSSSTINRNPALQVLNVTFSTTSPIIATNVTQVDGAPSSYWWFRNSRGNMDGEAKDFDTGDPGSIRWDDSSLVFTVSGTVYADDGVTPLVGGTCNGVATPVRVKVESGSTYDGTCSAVDGSFSIPGVTAIGDPTVTVFLNGASGGQKAVTVTKTPTADITDLDLYVNRIITRHEDVDPMTIADMAVYDNSDDSDIMFTAATGTSPLLTGFANTELFVWASSTFTPSGTVTLRSGGTGTVYDGSLHIDDGATFTGAGTTTYTVGGIFTLDTNGTFTSASSTVLMTATTSGKAIVVASGETATFNLLRFTGTNGSWNLNGDIRSALNIEIAAGTVTGTGNIAIPNGSLFGNGLLSLGGGTTTISRTNTLGGTQGWTLHNLVLGNGSIVGTTTPGSGATTTIGGRLTIRTGHYLDAGASDFDFSGTGTVFVESGTFLQDTSTVRYSGGGATNILSTGYYNLDLNAGAGTPTYTAVGLGISVANALTIGGQSSTVVDFNTNDSALDVNGSVTIASNGTLLGSNSGSFTVASSWDNNGTFTSNGGAVTFDGAGATTIDAGNSSFGTLVVNNGAGTFTVSENATTTSAFTLTSASSFTLSSSKTLAVGGVFTNGVGGSATTWTGSILRLFSGTNYQINAKTINDAYATLSIAPNTDIRMWNSSATAYVVDGTGSLYSQDHSAVDGDLYVYGNYPGNGSTDYWSYARDFDGTALGGGSRQVDVRFQSGASMALVSGGLQVLGSASASTSLQNQGSGTYGLRIGGTASTSWSYYDVEDINSSGLSFSGTPNVRTLSYGDFEISQAGGSGITVGGTVINANTARTFTNNIFSTTTAISGFNVTATGTTVSSWRFTNHAGTIDGESRDVDPGGDPGYIVWDDSSANVTISGNVYSDEGATVSTVCDSSTLNIYLVVAGLTTYTASCNGDGLGGGTGFYSISGVTFSPGDSLVVFINGETEKAAAVTEDLISSVSNMHLYENRVIVRHEDTDSLSIADMAVYDSSDDADIPFTAINAGTDTLTLPANRKLIVWTGKEFEPQGNVTLSGGGGGSAYDGTFEAQTNALVTFTGTEQHSIGGSFILGNGVTFDAGLSTTTFTTSGLTRTIDINNEGFYNTAFTGSGSWTITDATLDVNNLFITNGALTLPSGTTTVSGSWSNNGGSFVINGSTLVFTATSGGKVVRGGGSSFEELIFNGVGGSWSMTDTNATATAGVTITRGTVSLPSGIFSIGASFRNNGGSITHNTSELVLRSATAADIRASSSDLYALTVSGAGPFTMRDVNITLLDSLRITSGSLRLATGTLSIGGSLTASGGTFAHASGTILFNASATGKTVNPGSSSFYNVVFGSGAGGWTLSANATTTRNFTLSSASSFTVASGTRLYVGNVFTNAVGGSATTWNGSTLVLNSGSTYALNSKTTGGDNYQNLRIGANTDISMWNSRATSTVVTSSASLYSQDHATVNGALYIYGDYHISTTTRYWSYATDFDGTALGGSPRAVTVSLAANATTTVDGGTLNIIGTSGNETTITNQGSGTYAFDVTSGTINALYYRYRNLNADGLNFSGSPVIFSLSQGDYELAVNGGSLLTLSSTTLNANASLLITGNRFATTTAITGNNVTLIGTTSNAWTFVSHTGNLDGEAYDDDGVTACGSIRWSDSACLLTQQTHYRWRNNDGGVGVPTSEWFNANWDARKSVKLQNDDASTYTNAVVKLDVTFDGDMQTDFDDLRFTDESGTTTLHHYIERYTPSTEADVWVEVPTLAGAQTTNIYMYYKNPTASSTSSSTRTFIDADNFEDGNRTEYSGDTSLFTVDGTFAYGGSYGIDTTGNEGARATDGIARTDIQVTQGQILRYMQYVDTTAGSGDEVCTLFAVQSPVTANNNYAVCLEQFGTDRISLARNVSDTDSSGTILSSSTVAYSTGWYEVEIDWQTDDDMFVTLSQNGSVVASTSDNDGTYTSGGIGFTFWFQNGGWDEYSSRPRVDTEPTVRFGAEQTDAGATWKADIDTPTSYVSGDVARLRLAVENTGLQITNQTFDIEYADKGVAPSCEAVSDGSYTQVPPQASCGSSPVCMQTSTFITNGNSIADLLVGPEIDFTLGESIEDPSNTSDALTLNQNVYTELEYALTPTINAVEPNYCLRVTNNSDPLDTYLQVAELQMRFDPTVTSVSLNGGSDITLTPGSTTTVYVTGVVTDLNGYTDLSVSSSTLYRSGVGAACTANDNNCYISQGPTECTYSNCGGNSCDISCRADIYYHADPTDISPYEGEEWLAFIETSDFTGGMDIGSAASGVELLSLRALDVTSAIAYGSLAVSSTTGSYNPTTTIQNLGNNAIDINLEGTDLSDGLSSTIPTSEQLFATSSFTYTSCVYCTNMSSTTIPNYEVDLSKPTSVGSPVTDVIYWGIEIPFGVASNPHSGTNIFYAVGD